LLSVHTVIRFEASKGGILNNVAAPELHLVLHDELSGFDVVFSVMLRSVNYVGGVHGMTLSVLKLKSEARQIRATCAC